MVGQQPAVHRTILVVDVEGFGNERRSDEHRLVVRHGMYGALKQAFKRAGVEWGGCYYEDRGDGVLVLAPPDQPKAVFVESLPGELVIALAEHNGTHCEQEQIRLRMALHAGEVYYDQHGVTAASVNLTFRLVEAPQLKAALAESSGTLGLIASGRFFDEVIRHAPAGSPATYRPFPVTVKETATVGWIARPDDPYPPAQQALDTPPALPPPLVLHQLPARTSTFVGRAEELERLTSILDKGTGGQEIGGAVIISAINGTAGIGKTALALRWAHEVAPRFPDGQLYVNLRGFDSSVSPVRSADAIRGFLIALGEEPRRIGGELELDELAALYRSRVAGRQLLILLDNARDADQVRPLLPASSTCLVVVTSRNQLTSLLTGEGAHLLTLDLLSVAEAHDLLTGHLGSDRISDEPAVVDELIDLCARLPLALSIVAARAAAHPAFKLATLAGELRDAGRRLDALDGGDLSTNVQTVFSWSYRNLRKAAARMFRMLGIHPGPDISPHAAASLTGMPLEQARMALVDLTQNHLLAEHSPGRFAFHDLLRVYAAQQAAAVDTETERRAATHRMLDHYLHSAYTAALGLHPSFDPITISPPQPGLTPESLLASYAAAWAWFQAEYPVLLAVIQLAAAGWGTHAWQLAWTLTDYLARRGQWHDLRVIHNLALAAAGNHAGPRGEAFVHQGIGRAYLGLGRHAEARTDLEQALALFTQLGDQLGQAETHLIISWVLDDQDHPAGALQHAEQALGLYLTNEHRPGQASALNDIGWYHSRLGDHHQALTLCEQALALQQKLTDRRGLAYTLDSLGYAHHHLGRYQDAAAFYQQALDFNDELGDRHLQAAVLDRLGDTRHATGDREGAHASWRQALDILDQFSLTSDEVRGHGHPQADQIREKIRMLGNGPLCNQATRA
jgi:tetratricopeptide (TPR) repeat protein